NSPSRRGKPGGRVGTGPRSDRTLTLAAAAREYIWLYDYRHGVGFQEIAARDGVSVGRVRYGVERARAQDKELSRDVTSEQASPAIGALHLPRLIPLFPIGSYTPQSACPHREPIGQGSAFCCMVCHDSGMDAHPALQRDPRMDPIPEPKPGRSGPLILQPKV